MRGRQSWKGTNDVQKKVQLMSLACMAMMHDKCIVDQIDQTCSPHHDKLQFAMMIMMVADAGQFLVVVGGLTRDYLPRSWHGHDAMTS